MAWRSMMPNHPLYEVEPRAGDRGEVRLDSRGGGQPVADLHALALADGVAVHNQVQLLIG